MDIPWIVLPFTLYWPLIIIYFAVNIKKFRGAFYIPSGLLCIAIFFKSASALFELRNGTLDFLLWGVFNIPLLFGAYLRFYLKNKLCPHFGYWGAKADETGKYLFLNKEG